VGITDQQRVRIVLVESGKSGHRFRQSTGLLVGGCQVISDIVPQVAGVRFCPVQGIDSLGVLAIENVRIPDHEPGQGARVFLTVTHGIHLDSCIRCGSAVLDELPGHRLQRGRGDKSLTHATKPGG